MTLAAMTGATGFIGKTVTRFALDRYDKVRALVLPGDPGREDLEHAGVEVVEGDIRESEDVQRLALNAEVIFHLAAVVSDWGPWRHFKEVTVEGTRHVGRAALANGSKVVAVSTNDVFGLSEKQVLDESGPMKPWGERYPDSKVEAARLLWDYHETHGVPVSMVYPCWVYGPGDTTFVPLLVEALQKGQMMFWRKGALVWPAYVDNVADLMMVCATDDRAVGKGFLVHDGVSVTLEEFCARLSEAVGVTKTPRRIPFALAYVAAVVMEAAWDVAGKKTRPLLTTYAVRNLGSRLRFSIARAEQVLGWTPPVSFDEGLKRTLDRLDTVGEITGS